MKTLVVGAGLAGTATAMYLHRLGHRVRVIDAESRPHVGGYLMQLDKTAQRIAAELGLRDIVRDLSIETPGVTLRAGNHDVTGITLRGFRLARRGSFVTAVMQRASEEVPVDLGVRLDSLEHRTTGVCAHLDDGTDDEYDLVVGADGLHSTVRRLSIGRGPLYTNDLVSVWIDLPTDRAEKPRALVGWGRNRLLQLFPYPEKTTELAVVSYRPDSGRPTPAAALDRAAGILHAWGLTREAGLARSADPAGVRVTVFSQTRIPRWHHNRTVLVGDAAHCIDPLSGLGAHGAFHSARHLGRALATSKSPEDALRRYEQRARPVPRLAQTLTSALVDGLTADSMTHATTALRDAAFAGVAGTGVLAARAAAAVRP